MNTPSSHNTPAFQVHRVGAKRRGWRWAAVFATGLMILVVGFWFGSHEGAPSLASALVRAGPDAHRSELEREVEGLRARLAIAERSAQIAERAAKEVRGELIDHLNEIRRLHSELELYRGIVAERGSESGPRLFRFEMAPAAGLLELVLVRGQHDGKAASGHVEVRLLPSGGDQADPRELFERLAPVAKTDYAFEFFQRITLPLGVAAPTGMALVTLLRESKGAEPLHYLRAWPEDPERAGRQE